LEQGEYAYTQEDSKECPLTEHHCCYNNRRADQSCEDSLGQVVALARLRLAAICRQYFVGGHKILCNTSGGKLLLPHLPVRAARVQPRDFQVKCRSCLSDKSTDSTRPAHCSQSGQRWE